MIRLLRLTIKKNVPFLGRKPSQLQTEFIGLIIIKIK